jgi:D-alanyl-D-alanine carboxypeptidase
VAAAQRGDEALIAVILGSQEKRVWQDARHLLDYGFKILDSVTSGSKSLIIP